LAATNKDTGKIRDIIRKQYVEGIVRENGVREKPSMRELAQKHGVTANTICRWSRKNGWAVQREKFQERLSKQINTKRVDKLADKATTFDGECLSAANEVLQEVTRRLQEHLKAIQGDEDAEELAVYHLRELSQAALNGQKLGRLALGEASEITKGSIDVDGKTHFRETMDRLLKLRDGRRESHSGLH
jgi:transposase